MQRPALEPVGTWDTELNQLTVKVFSRYSRKGNA
jgi:hypothetical protein